MQTRTETEGTKSEASSPKDSEHWEENQGKERAKVVMTCRDLGDVRKAVLWTKGLPLKASCEPCPAPGTLPAPLTNNPVRWAGLSFYRRGHGRAARSALTRGHSC